MDNINELLDALKSSNTIDLKLVEQEENVKIVDGDIAEVVKDLKSLYVFLNTTNLELLPYPNPKTNFEKYLNACVLIPKIVKIYNQENVLDWDNTNQTRYLPYIKKVGSGWVVDSYSYWGSDSFGSLGHYYFSEDLCVKAMKNFNQVYLDFYTYTG